MNEKLGRLLKTGLFDESSEEGRSTSRYRRIILNSVSSILARGALALLGLIIIPLIVNRYGTEQFGLWATITATTTWITLFDLGIVNGLVISVSEAYGKGDKQLASKFVGTAFVFLCFSSLLIGAIIIALISLLPLETLFGLGEGLDQVQLRWLVLAAALPLIVSMPFSIVKQIYAGYQKSYVGNLYAATGSIITVLSLMVAINQKAGLPLLTALYVGVPGLFMVLNYFMLTQWEMKWLSLRLSQVSRAGFQRIMRSSIPLFLFQLGTLLVNQTQPIILAHRSNLTVVAEYAVVIRIQQAIMSVILMSTIAFTPSFREASERGDQGWVRKAFYRMLSLRLLLAILFGSLLVVAGNGILTLWLGEGAILVSSAVWIALVFLTVISTWVTAYSDLLVIMDRIWIQVLLVLGNGVSILLLTYLTAPVYGVLGAVLATSTFSVVILIWLLPLLSKPILRNERGIEFAETT